MLWGAEKRVPLRYLVGNYIMHHDCPWRIVWRCYLTTFFSNFIHWWINTVYKRNKNPYYAIHNIWRRQLTNKETDRRTNRQHHFDRCKPWLYRMTRVPNVWRSPPKEGILSGETPFFVDQTGLDVWVLGQLGEVTQRGNGWLGLKHPHSNSSDVVCCYFFCNFKWGKRDVLFWFDMVEKLQVCGYGGLVEYFCITFTEILNKIHTDVFTIYTERQKKLISERLFRVTLTKIHSIKINHIWTQISFNPKRAGLFGLSQVRGGGGGRNPPPPLGSRPRSDNKFWNLARTCWKNCNTENQSIFELCNFMLIICMFSYF